MVKKALGWLAILAVMYGCGDGRSRGGVPDSGEAMTDGGADAEPMIDSGTPPPVDSSVADGGVVDSSRPDTSAPPTPACTKTVTPIPGAGRPHCTTVRVDGTGNVHATYYDAGSDEVRYVTNASGSFVVTPIQDVGSMGLCSLDMALDPSGGVHIVYEDRSTSPIWTDYVTNASGAWVHRNALVHGLSEVRVEFDSTGTLYMVGRFMNDLELYEKPPGGEWSGNDLVPDGASRSNRIGFAVDGTDSLHVLFRDLDGLLNYATNASGAWGSDSFTDTAVDDRHAPAIVTIGGAVHGTYLDEAMGLRYLSDAGGTWGAEVLDSNGYEAALAAAPSGRAHIAYEHFREAREPVTELRYMPGGDGTLQPFLVTDRLRGDISLAVDTTGVAHLFYQTSAEGLEYARVSCP